MKSRNSRTPTQIEVARQVALGALSFLAGDPERIGPFLAESGLSPADLRGVAGSTAFHVALLDYMINRQELLIAYAGEAEIDPGHVVAAREILFHADMGED
ncbi:DUF3572 domain-containing protein [Ancylobacter dichloromethanicus]|uniref:DUF3572 domain-containing protein n=1 Tax=Ancylobacter dichloromethanicus TaxID=518825 RepID=A0A9W6J9J4_9HYPH|nr:DUF3572 domain-containing protein [Ancylobacter dichloromethanicus]MBS7554649.1 DUF3572 domain-containing protein [Ancylobacter dichloromethanicus]GLK71780.1 hypothetical protein GCM10017643_18950 [Ancylobacter dichloromethanicus]